ncbi:MAG TPA: hypothetical protein VGR05_09160 [Sphingomicrobium sp.]|nr:hypothetical protein [Sphingomicrobium sp.]
MAKPGTVIGWKLDRADRARLLDTLAPAYAEVVADHVTLDADAADKPLPPPAAAMIVGRTDDRRGVEAMVVSLDGSTDRPDGSTFHITWSLGGDRRAVESNDAIRDHGWTTIDPPLAVTIEPARF